MKWLHIYLVLTDGMIDVGQLKPQQVMLLLQLTGFDIGPAGAGARTAWASYPRSHAPTAKQHDIPIGAFELLIEKAKVAGFAERVPRVRGVVDTSDYSVNIDVSVRLDPQSPTKMLSFSMQSMGYSGPDALALAAFFAALCEVCGLDDEIRNILCASKTDP